MTDADQISFAASHSMPVLALDETVHMPPPLTEPLP